VASLSRSPSDDIQTWYGAAEEARQAGDIATAQAAVEQILEQDPRRPGALYLRGLLALDSDQFEAAQSWVERAIEVLPHPDFYITLCVIQIKLGAYASALRTARQGLARKPDSIRLRFYEAGALFAQGFLDDAAVSYRELLALEPDHVQVLTNLGVVAQDLDALEEAEQHLRRAIALAPESLRARVHLCAVLLATGRYEEAWPLHEDRWANFVTADGHRAPTVRPQVPLPQWRGERPESAIRAEQIRARGARLLVIPEQGHGDSLQFVRYLPLALERFSQVGYICPPSLRRLYEESLCSRWPGLVMLDDGLSGLDHWDWYCPMMSLPMAFGTRLNSIPAAMPYLFADLARAAAWRARLAALPDPGLPRVGVVWAGGHSGMMEDKVRSLTPAQIAPLLALRDIRWSSLQIADNPAKRADAACEARLTDWMDGVTDFADTAALIENLDLVIAVDTSVAHLAAAMGKPVWLLNRFAGCWRWLRDRDNSPWYPTVRLFNQRQRGDWDEVLTRVATALQQRFVPQDGQPLRAGSPPSESAALSNAPPPQQPQPRHSC
jgi:tetratricopeptide (TPR) repeat protein